MQTTFNHTNAINTQRESERKMKTEIEIEIEIDIEIGIEIEIRYEKGTHSTQNAKHPTEPYYRKWCP